MPTVADTLYVSGAVSNQGRFYAQFDAVVLLSAPEDVLLRRLHERTTNDFGKAPEDEGGPGVTIIRLRL